MSDIYKLYNEIAAHPGLPVEYIEKMLHQIPVVPVMDRAKYLVQMAKDKTIFDLGASGPMAEVLQKVAKKYYGADSVPNPKIKNFHLINFDHARAMPDIPDLDLIIAGEIIEHLSNAGHFLNLLYRFRKPVILTVPNAFSEAGKQHLARGFESVNKEHVAWYSYHTLKVLIERHGFNIVNWYWYNGKPLVAEGLIFHMEPND